MNSLGKPTVYEFDTANAALLDRFENPSPAQSSRHNPYTIVFESDELTALCPRTAQPDFYDARITITPDKWCLEAKSLKLYLFSFRNVGMFVEAMANKIAQDIYAALAPRTVTVVLRMAPRGGIPITVTVERP